MKSYFRGVVKGSYTVEAAIIFSFIFMVLITLIFASLLICEKVILNKAAAISASRSAAILSNTKLLGTADDYSLYNRLNSSTKTIEYCLDISTELASSLDKASKMKSSANLSDKKQGVIQYEVSKQLAGCIIKPKRTFIKIKHYEGFFNENITISIRQEISIPLGFVKRWFDGKDTVTLEAQYEASAVEASEYIRNMDIVFEYSKRIKEGINPSEILNSIKGNLGKQP